ncbi:hypothetical protein ACFPM0_33400 [Pseudonocardia sulfidoxydans]
MRVVTCGVTSGGAATRSPGEGPGWPRVVELTSERALPVRTGSVRRRGRG